MSHRPTDAAAEREALSLCRQGPNAVERAAILPEVVAPRERWAKLAKWTTGLVDVARFLVFVQPGWSAMSLGAVPDDGEMHIAGTGMWHAGRQLHAASGVPVVWVSDRALTSAGLIWTDVAEESAESGLQPFLLSGMDGGTARPWDTGEHVGDPEDTTAIDGMDAAQVLEGWWWAPSEDEFAEDEELREMFAPFGARFRGLAPAVAEELDPELMRRAVFQYTPPARIGLVPAARPADILPRLGWAGACNHRTASELAVVLRSWEDRFGARLLVVGFDDIRLLVSRPPQTLEAAHPIAAEHFAFADEAHRGPRRVPEIARALVNNPFWDFWWD
jgi:hypothetical protein